MASPPLIIGAHGFKQSGKDTFADLLVREYGYRRIAFADRVKDAIHVIFGVPREHLYGSNEDKQRPSGVRWDDLHDIVREKKDDPNVLYRLIRFSNGNEVPFEYDFELDDTEVSVYTMRRFDTYHYEEING